jgi:hypothetical protein
MFAQLLIYTAGCNLTNSSKFIYADDTALAYRHKDVKQIEAAVTENFSSFKNYFRT